MASKRFIASSRRCSPQDWLISNGFHHIGLIKRNIVKGFPFENATKTMFCSVVSALQYFTSLKLFLINTVLFYIVLFNTSLTSLTRAEY